MSVKKFWSDSWREGSVGGKKTIGYLKSRYLVIRLSYFVMARTVLAFLIALCAYFVWGVWGK